jgi:hypothetical protein
MRREAVALYECDGGDDPELVCWAGLEPVVREVLTRAGYAVRLRDAGPGPLPRPDFLTTANDEVVDHALFAWVHGRDRGLIRYAPEAVDPARLLVELAVAFRPATLAVAVARAEDAFRLRKQIQRFLPDTVAVTSRRRPAQVGRVVLATYAGLAHLPVALEHRHIVVALDAIEAVGEQPRYCLSHARRARLYGLLPRDRVAAPYERDWLTALFGFHEIVLPRHGCVERPVQVVWVPITGGEALPWGTDLRAVLRLGLWRHGLRNRRVAKVARLFKLADRPGLRAQLPSLGDSFLTGPFHRVLVLVQNVEHGLALSSHLDGWPVLVGERVWTAGLTREQRASLVPAARADSLTDVIVTPAGLAGVPLADVDVLIRADGGTGLPAGWDGNYLQDKKSRPSLLLVDFRDRHHPVLRRRSRQRREAYQANGWFALGTNPVQARVEHFLATRPKGDA